MKRLGRFCLAGVFLSLVLGPLAVVGEPGFAFGGGGPTLGLLMPNLAEINAFVIGAGYAPFAGNLFLVGGGGRGGLIPGPIYGGSGWGAWIESSQGGLVAEYGIGLGGFEMGYALGGDESSILSIGATLGGGAAELVFTEVPWIESLGAGPRGIVVEPTRVTYDSVFFFAAPYAEMQVQFSDWIGLAVRASYVWAPIEFNWSDEGPLDPPNLAPTGIYVGFTVVFGEIVDLLEN